MILRHSPAAARHDPEVFFRHGRLVPHPESIGRYEALHGAVSGIGRLVPAGDHGLAPILAVHDRDYVDLLQHGFARGGATDPDLVELLPTQFAPRTPLRRPEGLVGQLGFHMTDTSTPLRRGTWDAVYGAAQTAVAAADDLGTQSLSYALCRPPGHHAARAQAGGFCYLNNAAIAAERLRTTLQATVRTGAPKVAILDIDVHHGNGTQAIFYDRADILYVSVHAETADYFPYFSGYADEIGVGEGAGFTLNLPLPLGSGDRAYRDAVVRGLERIAAFGPDAVVVSLGLDVAAGDPIGAFEVSGAGFAAVAREIAALRRPTAVIQEGGYPAAALGANLLAFLSPLVAAEG